MDRDELIALMDAETWLTADEVVERGLADRVEDAKAAAASLSAEGLVIRSEILEMLKEISSKLANGTLMRQGGVSMRIWKLDCDVNTYENLTMVGEFDLELSLSFDGRRKLPTWEPLAVKRMDRRRFSNTPGFASHIPVFDRRAVDALAGLMGDYVEVLPLACADGEFYAINVVEVLDCIDYERSQFLRFADSQRIMLFEKYEFVEHIVDGKPIFKIADERLGRPFVSDAFRQTVMQNNLTGFVFELAWDSEVRNV